MKGPPRTNVEEVLDGTRVAELVGHHRDVVEAVKVRKRLGVVLVLDELFGSAVQEADMRVGAENLFAVQFEDEAEHTVRGWVLRAKVEGEVAHRFFSGFEGRIEQLSVSFRLCTILWTA